jgi:hypothetical protein
MLFPVPPSEDVTRSDKKLRSQRHFADRLRDRQQLATHLSVINPSVSPPPRNAAQRSETFARPPSRSWRLRGPQSATRTPPFSPCWFILPDSPAAVACFVSLVYFVVDSAFRAPHSKGRRRRRRPTEPGATHLRPLRALGALAVFPAAAPVRRMQPIATQCSMQKINSSPADAASRGGCNQMQQDAACNTSIARHRPNPNPWPYSSASISSCRILRYRLERCRPSMRAASLTLPRARSSARST